MVKKGLASAAVFLLSLMLPAASEGESFWAIEDGSTTLNLRTPPHAELTFDRGDESEEGKAVGSFSFEIRPDSTLTIVIHESAGPSFLGGDVLHLGALTVKSSAGHAALQNLAVGPTLGAAFETEWRLHGGNDFGGLIMDRYKAGFYPAARTLTFHCPDLRISQDLAEALGDSKLANESIGDLTMRAKLDWLGGRDPAPVTSVDAGASRTIGPDMTFCQLYGLAQYGRLGDIVGLAVATTSWNVGDRDLMWFPSPESEHPFIVMNLYRLKDDRFEQIGQSSVKHGFYALGSQQCGTPCTFEPGHSAGRWLGVGCTDTYSSYLNAAQSGLAPRSEVNPWTGEWQYQGSHFSQGSHSHNQIQHRLQVRDADLNPAQNPGAAYYVEGYYVILDDVNVMNSAAWKPVSVSGSPGGTWSFSMSGATVMPNSGFAIDTWTGATQTMLAQEVPPIEFVSPDGRCVLSAKATDLGGGTWRYEYALLNIDMHRKVKLFTIPIRPWMMVDNVGFHAVFSHDEPYSNLPWTVSDLDEMLVWSTSTNPLRWGTVYNFRFDANAPPVNDATVKLGHYEPGTPEAVTGLTIGPDTSVLGNAIRGGLLWDKWWAVTGAPAPTGNHPLYPPAGQQSGSATYRCKECHGWDYKGRDGAYGSGPHYTGIRGVYGTGMDPIQMYNIIMMDYIPNGHGFGNYGLTDQDVMDLVKFIQEGMVDTDLYIDAEMQFMGDEVQGQINYEYGGWISCIACHGEDGAAINFGTPDRPEFVGTIATYNPWELFHKTRFGQPGMPPMGSWLDWGGTDQGAADLGLYCQLNLPADCLTADHCLYDGPCNMCQTGRCVPSVADGDFTDDGRTDGADLQWFIDAVVAGSTDPYDCARGDFNGNGVMDDGDIPCMVGTLLGP